MSTPATATDNRYVSPVELLCVTCKQPIKATITTEQWIKCEWISPRGQCRACDQQAKEISRG